LPQGHILFFRHYEKNQYIEAILPDVMFKQLNLEFKFKASNWSLKQKVGLTMILGAIVAFGFCLPEPLFKSPTSFVVESANGELLSAAIASDGQWRFPAADSVPTKFRKCIVAFEDKNFYKHPGVDPIAIARAIEQNLKEGKVVSGASTLDMQVIRLASKHRRTYFNKVIEAIKALRLNIRYSKDEILNLYAAHAPFGTNVVGLEAAAWRYFGRDASKLSWG
jgi:penicillin-binding protein 1C